MSLRELAALRFANIHNLSQAMLLVNSRAGISIYMFDVERMVLRPLSVL